MLTAKLTKEHQRIFLTMEVSWGIWTQDGSQVCWREGEAADRGSAWRTGSSEDEPMAERGGQLAAKLANNRKNAKYGEKMI